MTTPPADPGALDLDAFRHLAAYAGLSLSEPRLAEVRPLVEAAHRSLVRLSTPELRDVEPPVTAPPLEDE